ncbi:hypothetical protein Tco_1121471 [Tanacetum coccineum]|uniref:CCHC-type domain-containing protein n=1 Tax=Tanacetum coccineum TaxID=301880 RepID=A0ABQ5IY72_9ASTR
MASSSFQNPLTTRSKNVQTCGSLYTKECCSIGSFEDKILTPVPSPRCARCGTPVDGPSCRGYFQDTSESSDDNTNVVNALREPFVVNQDPGVKSSQDPPQIDHNCCYECGDSLDGIFCQQCICKFCGKGAHYGYNCPPKVPIISNPEQCNQTINELPQILPNENSFIYNSKPHSFNVSPSVLTYPPQLQFETYFGVVLCPHFDYQCQPINETYYEPNPSYDYSGFDQPQPPQDSVDCQEALDKILEELEELKRDQRMLKELKKRIAEEQTAKENMSIEEMRHEEQLVDYKIKEIINDLGSKRFRGEKIDEEYKRDCEIRIRKLKQDFNEWGSKVRKKEQAYEEEKYSAACRYMLSITCDDEDDYIPLGDIIARNSTSKAITPYLIDQRAHNSLKIGEEILDTIAATESGQNYLIKVIDNLWHGVALDLRTSKLVIIQTLCFHIVMSTSTHPIIILSNSNVGDAFSSMNTPDYILTLPDYFPASLGNTSSNPSEDLSKDLLASLAISPFHDDPYMKVMQAYNATSNKSPIPLP